MKLFEKLALVGLALILVVGLIGLQGSHKLGAYNTSNFSDLAADTASITTLSATNMSGSVVSTSTAAAGTFTAANICGTSLIKATPSGATSTLTFPATSTLFTTCLGSVGNTAVIDYESISTSTVLAAGAGGTLSYTSSSTVAAGKSARIILVHDATNTYQMNVINFPN